MKLAVIDHIGNPGGSSRVIRALLPAIKKIDGQIEITYFGTSKAIRRESIVEEFSPLGIKVVKLSSIGVAFNKLAGWDLTQRLVDFLRSNFFGRRFLDLTKFIVLQTGDVTKDIERRVRGFDLAFYPWPFHLSFPKTECPSVGIFHDFNFKYYFSGDFAITKAQRRRLETDMPIWLDNCVSVVSSYFMERELKSFYPAAKKRNYVIHLPPLGGFDLIPPERAYEIIDKLGVRGRYLLCPTQTCSHKNVGPLISSVEILNARGWELTLVFTGGGTECIRGVATDIGVRLNSAGGDVLGLGYVSNIQMDSLIQCANVVVNPSLYEAGNGAGIDAFGRGTPIAMSNIPSFTEHLEIVGMKAQIFDPRSPEDIANKIQAILEDQEGARSNPKNSQEILNVISWEKVAKAYLNVFHDAINDAR